MRDMGIKGALVAVLSSCVSFDIYTVVFVQSFASWGVTFSAVGLSTLLGRQFEGNRICSIIQSIADSTGLASGQLSDRI